MKLSMALSAAVLAAGLGTSAFAQDCASPALPTIPDGATATEPEMVQGQQAVKSYMAESSAFLSCLEEEGKAFKKNVERDKSLSKEDRQKKLAEMDGSVTTRYNSEVERQEAVAAQFNTAVKDYRAQSGE